jgi:hypothetical protein
MEDDIENTTEGWYFYMRGRACKIGAYRLEEECREDYKRYMETGMISGDVRGDVGPKCADCE